MKTKVYKKVNISLHPSVLKQLDSVAKELNVTRSGLISDLVRIIASVKDNEQIGLMMLNAVKDAIKPLS